MSISLVALAVVSIDTTSVKQTLTPKFEVEAKRSFYAKTTLSGSSETVKPGLKITYHLYDVWLKFRSYSYISLPDYQVSGNKFEARIEYDF
jgi:hypothetical protein